MIETPKSSISYIQFPVIDRLTYKQIKPQLVKFSDATRSEIAKIFAIDPNRRYSYLEHTARDSSSDEYNKKIFDQYLDFFLKDRLGYKKNVLDQYRLIGEDSTSSKSGRDVCLGLSMHLHSHLDQISEHIGRQFKEFNKHIVFHNTLGVGQFYKMGVLLMHPSKVKKTYRDSIAPKNLIETIRNK